MRAQRPALLLLAVVTTACSGGASSPNARPSSDGRTSSSGSAPGAPAASQSADTGVVVAVTRKSGALELHRIGNDRRAHRFAMLEPPRGGTYPRSVSLTAGPAPDACVVWGADPLTGDDEAPLTVLCYPHGTTAGVPLGGATGRVLTVALRADGGAVAWVFSHGKPTYQTDVVVADLRDGSAVNQRRAVYDPQCPPSDGEKCLGFSDPHTIAWAGDGALALSVASESDEASDLRRLPLTSAAMGRGWPDGAALVPVPEQDAGYRFFDDVVSADGRSALAIERDGGTEEARKPQRAVRVELATGRVLGLVSTPLPGREVQSVSGGNLGVVYVTRTSSGESRRVYLRLPGETRGTIVTGLPSDVVAVVAQP